jgi:hypothetical protein
MSTPPIQKGHVMDEPHRADQESSNNPDNPEHPKVGPWQPRDVVALYAEPVP